MARMAGWWARCVDFFGRRPALRDALLWSLPGILLGLAARVWLFCLFPRNLIGADSFSYFVLAASALFDSEIEFPDKRRWIYPILLLVFSASPFDPLILMAVVQRTLGFASIAAVGYAIRKSCPAWRLAVPLGTSAYAVVPLLLNGEIHNQSGVLMAPLVAFAMAGWASWAGGIGGPRSRRWWSFFVPMALALLSRPAVWFVVPGLGLGFLATGLWRGLTLRRIIAAVAMLPLLMAMGSEGTKHAHLIDGVFPIIQLERPAHAEYKAEIAHLIRRARAGIDHAYLVEGDEDWHFISKPQKQDTYPLWRDLGKAGDETRFRVYSELAREAILAEPHLYAYMVLQRIAVMMSLGMPAPHLGSDKVDPMDFLGHYEAGLTGEKPRRKMMERLFAVGPEGRMLGAEEAMRRYYPGLLSPARETLRALMVPLGEAFAMLSPKDASGRPVRLWEFRPTIFGCLVALGLLVAWMPARRRVAGPWALSLVVFFATAFLLVSEIRDRHMVPVAPILIWMAALAIGGCAAAVGRALDAVKERA